MRIRPNGGGNRIGDDSCYYPRLPFFGGGADGYWPNGGGDFDPDLPEI